MLGELIKDLRDRRRLTQVELADLARLDRSWVSRIETNGIRTPDPRKLRLLASALQVDADELYVAAGYLRRNESQRPIEDMSMEELTIHAERLWAEMSRRVADGQAKGVWRSSHSVTASRERMSA